jgi:hypothetical protein
MKTTLYFLFICIGSHFAIATTLAKTEFLKKFPIKEGHYQTIPEKNKNWEACQDEQTDIDLRDMTDNLTLTIGAQLVFPELQKNEYISSSEKNCSMKIENEFKAQSLRQTVSETCGKKLTSKRVHVFTLEKENLVYEFTTDGTTHRCRYQFLSATGVAK